VAVLNPGGVTVLGNFVIDRIDDAAPSPGGCPSFAPTGLSAVGGGRIVARLAAADRGLFAGVLDEFARYMTVLPAETTCAFGLRYDGEQRSMTVDAIGDPWTAKEVEAASIDSRWVHLAAILRSDFPPSTLARLVAAGHRISYDGQGLVRIPECGRLRLDSRYDRALLDAIHLLKLNEEEAEVVAGGEFDLETAKRLGCPEVVVTLGSGGCDVYADGAVEHVPARPVLGIHTTGAGDVFMVSYAAARARGETPVAAAERGSAVVADMLEERRGGGDREGTAGRLRDL
jgi:sugar/nucleoside kinase (ribokinase family)